MAKEQSIRHMEKVEADMLERIKNTQNLQIQAFNQLEEVMYQQQFTVQHRLANPKM